MYLVVCPRIHTKLPRDIIKIISGLCTLRKGAVNPAVQSVTIPKTHAISGLKGVVLNSIDDILYYVVCSTPLRMND